MVYHRFLVKMAINCGLHQSFSSQKKWLHSRLKLIDPKGPVPRSCDCFELAPRSPKTAGFPSCSPLFFNAGPSHRHSWENAKPNSCAMPGLRMSFIVLKLCKWLHNPNENLSVTLYSPGNPQMSCGSMILPTKNELMRGFPIIVHYYSIVIPLLFHNYSMTIPLLFHYYYSLIIPLLFPEDSLIVPFKFHSSSTMIPLNSQKLGENPPFFSPPQLHRWAARPFWRSHLALPAGDAMLKDHCRRIWGNEIHLVKFSARDIPQPMAQGDMSCYVTGKLNVKLIDKDIYIYTNKTWEAASFC